MKSTVATLTTLVLAASACGASRPVLTTAAHPDPLSHEIQVMDDSLSGAFNAHRIDPLMSFFATDLEFYHDTEGLQNSDAVRAGFSSLFASNNGIRRERVGTLEVYPIPNYGAIEVGAHRFCHEESGRTACGTFKFVHVWHRQTGGWKIARVVSYGHFIP